MDEALRHLVWSRAGDVCEYCLLAQRFDLLPFQLDHILATKHHGPTTADNPAWCCYNCNIYKGPNVAGIDPATGVVTRLYHPRLDRWHEHCSWDHAVIEGRTPVGRCTVDVLRMNSPERIEHRRLLIEANIWGPPSS